MPPEMIKRVRHSYPADIWSFGISLLELANNKPPNYQNQLTVKKNLNNFFIYSFRQCF